VVPADHKYLARALVGGILVDVIDRMGLRLPRASPAEIAQLDKGRARLLAE
jgi:hypothetical protein